MGQEIELPYNPAIPLVGIYSKDLKAGIQTGNCAPMFLATLFTMAKGKGNLSVH